MLSEAAHNGSLLAAVAAVAFRQFKCRDKDEKKDVTDWLASAAMAASIC